MSRVAGTQYTISAPTRRCAATDRELNTGEEFVAVLAQTRDTDDFVRLDYSAQAWREGARPDKALVVLGFWKATVPDPSVRKRLLIDDQSLVEMFEQGGEEGENGRERAAFRFVLALVLLRKRLIVQEGSKGRGGRTMLVRVRGTPRPPEGPAYIEVEDPGLDEAAIASVTGQIGALMNGDEPAASAEREKGGSA